MGGLRTFASYPLTGKQLMVIAIPDNGSPKSLGMDPMPRLRDLAAVGGDYATTGPNHRLVRRLIPTSADSLFRLLEDGPATRQWQGIDVEWTSEPPVGVGATRTVRGMGQTIEESVLAWEPGRRMCLRYDRATLPLAAFAEDYIITPTADSTCELGWHYAFEWAGPAKSVLGPLFGIAFAVGARRDLEKLAGMIPGDQCEADSQA